jgi:hypothetical protein
MTGIESIYAEAVHRNFRRFFANYPPNSPVGIGALGFVRNYVFDVDRVNALKPATKIDSGHDGTFAFQHGKSISFSSVSKGELQAGGNLASSAKLSISFGHGKSIFFNAAGCTVRVVADRDRLAKEILSRFARKEWNAEHVIVTGIVKASALTLLATSDSGGSVELTATSDVPSIDLANASTRLKALQSTSVQTQFVTARSTVPLLIVGQIVKRVFLSPKFRTRYLIGGPQDQDLNDARDKALRDGKAIEDEFAFAEIDDTPLITT